MQRRRLVLLGQAHDALAADVGMIERVLTNLLDNAVRHSSPGGRIEVRLRAAGGRIMVTISDCGPGIPTAQRPIRSSGRRRSRRPAAD